MRLRPAALHLRSTPTEHPGRRICAWLYTPASSVPRRAARRSSAARRLDAFHHVGRVGDIGPTRFGGAGRRRDDLGQLDLVLRRAAFVDQPAPAPFVRHEEVVGRGPEEAAAASAHRARHHVGVGNHERRRRAPSAVRAPRRGSRPPGGSAPSGRARRGAARRSRRARRPSRSGARATTTSSAPAGPEIAPRIVAAEPRRESTSTSSPRAPSRCTVATVRCASPCAGGGYEPTTRTRTGLAGSLPSRRARCPTGSARARTRVRPSRAGPRRRVRSRGTTGTGRARTRR